MVRNRCKKTKKGVDPDKLRQAAIEVKERNVSINQAAMALGIPRATLQRYMKASSSAKKNWKGYGSVADAQRTFSLQQEKTLADHIKLLDNMFHGLSAEHCRQLEYCYASATGVNIPPKWKEKNLAGEQANFFHLKCAYGRLIQLLGAYTLSFLPKPIHLPFNVYLS